MTSHDPVRTVTRRRLVASSAGALVAAACRDRPQGGAAEPARSAPGGPRRAYGERSPFERSMRETGVMKLPGTGVSLTPLQDLHGIITPSSLHFESHHAGVPSIDPERHELLVHGLTERALAFGLADLKRFPSVSRIHFIECSGNSGREHAGDPGEDPQQSHGQISCSEWTGVRLSTVLNEAGLSPGARWVIAEGVDACRLARSLPLDKALDDVLVAYGQNGEALRPEQGYPLRLVVPGWEGSVSVKWLGRLHVVDRPYMTQHDTTYSDLMPDGKARQFTFVMEAKSVITRPAGRQRLGSQGFCEIVGLAWSGRGRVRRVEVSTDGGATWKEAALQDPVLPMAFTRFTLPWVWDGAEAILQSRCTDETGYVQPTREQLVTVRGVNATDHHNGIKAWHVGADGRVTAVPRA